MQINIQGTHLKVTDELNTLVNKKLQDVLRMVGSLKLDAVSIAIELEHLAHTDKHQKNGQPYRAEATVTLPGHQVRAETYAATIEQAVVKLKHVLSRDVKKWRDGIISKRRKEGRATKEMQNQETLGSVEAGKDEQRVEDWDAAKQTITKKPPATETEKPNSWDEIDKRDLV